MIALVNFLADHVIIVSILSLAAVYLSMRCLKRPVP